MGGSQNEAEEPQRPAVNPNYYSQDHQQNLPAIGYVGGNNPEISQ